MNFLSALSSNLPFSRPICAPSFMLIVLVAYSPLLSQQATDECESSVPSAESQISIQVDHPDVSSGPVTLMGTETMSIHVENQEVRMILQNIAELYKLKVSIPEDLHGRASINLTDVTWQQVFDVILKERGYSWAAFDEVIRIRQGTFDQRDPRVLVLPNGNIRIKFRNTSPMVIISSIARALDLNVVIPPDRALTGSFLNIRLTDVSWAQTFRVVLNSYGYGYVFDGDVVVVRSSEQIASIPNESWDLELKNLEAEALGRLLSEVSGVENVDTDTTSNVVTVTAYPLRLRKIKDLVERLDQPGL